MDPLVLRCARRPVLVLGAALILLFTAGCGSGGSVILPLGGNYSNASLNGQYVIAQTGIGFNQSSGCCDPFSETIIAIADGKGNLNVPVDDFDQVGGPYSNPNLSGTYQISKDGTGSMVINFPTGSSTYAITMIDDSHFYIIEQDSFATASGFGEKQDTSAFSGPPSGTFVFKAHDVTISSRVGGITIAAGVISGTEDLLDLGLLSSSKAVSSIVAMTPPGQNGRGTFALNDGTSFTYYVVNANKFRFMSNSASGSLEIGQAEAQTGGPFSPGILASGASYVFGSAGEDGNPLNGQLGIHSAGVFTSDGNGNVTGGAVDYVQDTFVNSNLTVTGGSYTLASNGRGQLNLTLSGGVISPQIFWMVNATQAYFLVNSTSAVEDGTFSMQQGAPFSALTSQAALVMDGFDVAYKDRTGAFQPASGGFNWNQSANSFDTNPNDIQFGGSPSSLGTNGTYQVSSNGRVAVSVNGVTPSLVFYLSAPNTGVMVQEDANIGGSFAQQSGQ